MTTAFTQSLLCTCSQQFKVNICDFLTWRSPTRDRLNHWYQDGRFSKAVFPRCRKKSGGSMTLCRRSRSFPQNAAAVRLDGGQKTNHTYGVRAFERNRSYADNYSDCDRTDPRGAA